MKLKAIGDPSVGVILGFLVFTVIFGWKILDPTYFDWLTSYNNDPIMNFLGWHFFRFEDWTFPLGLIKNFGTPDGSSLVYVDSIPLLALPFKLLRGILPPIFQYAGLWLLSCYVLQGFFAWLLAKKITSNLISRIVITLFFTISPIMLYRADRHEALTGHWMILAAIYLYVISVEKLISVEKINKDINSPCLIRWTLLLVATSLVHFYLCAM
ncbi:MAG: DUF6311 domain-containing protein, partial [Proteobacteria bacterium]|nr:DUF6311 domain-containing protein [Pseudomonadota bacterium]